MKILVTGGNGFIGSRICKDLKEKGHDVKIYDLPDDILDEFPLGHEISQADMVLHVAAMADINVCQEKQFYNFQVNVKGTYNVAMICADMKKKLIFISTSCIYGNSLDDEEIEFKTASMASEPYAASKIAGEYIVRGTINLDWVILRIGTVYGKGMREALFTYIALNNILKDQTIWINGSGMQNRQFIYIDDLIEGISLAVEKFDRNKGDIFNLAGKDQISVLDVIDVAEKVVGKKAKRKHREERYGEIYKENISIERSEKKLGWAPKTEFKDGMRMAFKEDKRFK